MWFVAFAICIVLIALCIHFAMSSSAIGPRIEADEEKWCHDCDKNVICGHCWGLIEQHCSCRYRVMRQCQCVDPRRL